MGKGDLRTRRGKIYNGSHGKKRPVESRKRRRRPPRAVAPARSGKPRKSIEAPLLRGVSCVWANRSGAACDPTFNWREFRSPDGFAVSFPGRPQTITREVRLPDATVQMSMTSAGIGATLFAVGVAQLPASLSADAAGRQRTAEYLRDALVRNIHGARYRGCRCADASPCKFTSPLRGRSDPRDRT